MPRPVGPGHRPVCVSGEVRPVHPQEKVTVISGKKSPARYPGPDNDHEAVLILISSE